MGPSSKKPAASAVANASPPPLDHSTDHAANPSTDQNAQPTDHDTPPDPQPGSAAEPPTIDLPDDHVGPSTRPVTTSHAGSAAPGAISRPGGTATSGTVATPGATPGATTGSGAPSASKPAGTAAATRATPGATVEAPVSADGCDKVSCVIDAYARPCCEPFRPRKPGETPRELDRDMILAGMSKAKAAVIHCGEATPSAKGIVRLAMKVAADGSVVDASVAEAPDPTLGECVAAAVRKVTFAQTDQGGTFNYPFKF
jgi:hypothetical protein